MNKLEEMQERLDGIDRVIEYMREHGATEEELGKEFIRLFMQMGEDLGLDVEDQEQDECIQSES